MEVKEEKGRGRRRQHKQPWERAVELKVGQGGGGILILGGVLIAAAVGAGTAFAARRAQRRRISGAAKGAGGKEEKLEDFGAARDDSASNLQRESQIDSATDDCQDNKSISKKPDAEGTKNSFEEEVNCNQELSVAIKLDVNSPGEIILRKPDSFLGDEKEIGSTEAEIYEAQPQLEQVVEESEEAKVVLIESPIDASQNPSMQILEESEFAFVSQAKESSLTESKLELGQEEDDKEASSAETENGKNHQQSEQFIEGSKEDDKEASSAETENGKNHQQSEQFIEGSKEDDKEDSSIRSEYGMKHQQSEQFIEGSKEDDKEDSSIRSEYGMNHQQSEQFIEGSKEDDKEASSIGSEYGMSHQQSEQLIEEYKFASGKEDKEDEASLRNDQIDITESDVQRTTVVIETDEEIQSIKRQFSTKVCPRDPVVDGIMSTCVEETQKEEKISSSESLTEMTDQRTEASQELGFFGIKELDEQEQEEASSESQLHMNQLQNEQELHENMLEEEDKEILSIESEYDLIHQTEQFSEESELAYGVADDESRDNQIQPTTIESQSSAEGCGSNHVSEESEHDTERETDKEEGELSTTSQQNGTEAMDEFYYTEIQSSTIRSQFRVEECQSDHVTDESESATEEEETENEEEELLPTSEEKEPEMIEETDSPRVSSEESNADAIWPAELIEQEKSLQVAECKDSGHQSVTSESVPRTERTVENFVEPKLISKTQKTLITNNFFMIRRSVLFVLLLVMAVTSTRLFYQLFQITLSNKQSAEEL